VINAVKQPQSVLLLGGTSEIGLAIVRTLPGDRLQRVVLAGRPSERLDEAAADMAQALPAVTVETARFDADEPTTHRGELEAILGGGDIDVVIVAFGLLGDQSAINADPAQALQLIQTNYVGGASALLQTADLLKEQGRGSIIVLSSVAGDRARAANFVYGSTKAGIDALSQGLADSLHGSGVSVLVVRPGFVRTRMTEGLDEAPFSTTADDVAADTVKAWKAGKEVVYSPKVLRAVMGTMKVLPRPIFRIVSAR
jgi:decaprenylphospho-beta-D-erythro-pentofuranosid-2-ulose 2-reductase